MTRGAPALPSCRPIYRRGSDRAVVYAFDLFFLDGEDLRSNPLEERRLALASINPKGSAILLSEEYGGPGADLFKIACEHELEGIVSKRIDKPYRSGRRTEWLKTKCIQSDTFVIIGYQPRSGAVRGALANLKVATFDGARLRYAGAVGTGFSEAIAAALRERRDRIAMPRCPVAGLKIAGAVWVSPDLRAEIAYRGLTGRRVAARVVQGRDRECLTKGGPINYRSATCQMTSPNGTDRRARRVQHLRGGRSGAKARHLS